MERNKANNNSLNKNTEIKKPMKDFKNIITSYNVSTIHKRDDNSKPRLFKKTSIQSSFNIKNKKRKILFTNISN